VRRGILTGVVALGAVVAEIGKVIEIGGGKVGTTLKGREDGAITFAIPAGVADRKNAIALVREAG
jgi:hypothetical protein